MVLRRTATAATRVSCERRPESRSARHTSCPTLTYRTRRTRPLETHHELPRRPPVPREPAAPDHHGGTLCAGLDSFGLPGRHPHHDGGADPEGGRLLRGRRDRAAPARARTRRQGQQATVDVQRADRRRAQGRARDGDPGRRLHQLRTRRRRRCRQMAERRHAAHAGRARSQARPGDGDREHDADERHRTRRHRRLQGRVAGLSPALRHLQGHGRAVQPQLGGRAHPSPVGSRHPERVPVLQHQQLRDHRAH
jgi:hypothetical protein